VTRFRPASALALLGVLAVAPAASPRAAAAPVVLPDSTTFESFTLANGLRVVTRHVPGGDRVAIAVAYRFGSSHDPEGAEGLHALLAELAFFGPAGEAAARTRAEMASQRPAGWDVWVGPHSTMLIEIATLPQLPGVLRQVAQRMRGVSPTAATLAAAQAEVRADLARRWSSAGDALYLHARAAAEGRSEASIAREASGAGIAGRTLKELAPLLRERFVPANAVLSLAGNLSSLPLRDVLEREFGVLPAGVALPARPAARLDTATRVVTLRGLAAPAAVVGVIAPALDDSLHPVFYAAALLFGTHAGRQWGKPASAIGTRFRYILTEDAGLVRVFPPLAADDPDGARMMEEYLLTVRQGTQSDYADGTAESLWRGVDWVLGGPVPPERIGRTRSDGAALAAIATGQAFRETTGGEAFWSAYRERFKRAAMTDFRPAIYRLAQPERLVRVIARPAP